jgi:hypothetical protein
VTATGCDQVHGSLRGRAIDLSASARPELSFGTARNEREYGITDYDAVAGVRAVLDEISASY